MVEINKIYNKDCIEFMGELDIKVDCVLTSPPYNTGRFSVSDRARENREARYDIHIDNLQPDEYINWTLDLFRSFDNILSKNGVVIYNLSYSSDGTVNKNTDLMWRVLSKIIENTNFTIADRIIWKKSSALPNNVSPNKLTRIVEDVFVFCRKNEYKTFSCNKEVASISKTGQNYYKNYFNFIEAKNNDGPCKLNKATYSTDLCVQLLSLYCKEGDLIYDPFIGTGTTAVACKELGMNYIGTELSKQQCEYAQNRIGE